MLYNKIPQPRDMDLPRYEYEPLNGPDEIRVLELSATKKRIEACILHVSISSRSFQALSYVWGKPAQANEAVVVDKLGRAIGRIPLTGNLGNAICDLRDAEELESKVFWIDQICINQQDEEEKGHQVAMMSRIYTQARRVITYLGPIMLKKEEKQGIRLLKRIYENISDDTWAQMRKAGSINQIRDWKLDGSIQSERLPSDLDLVADKSYHENEISKRYVEQGWEWLVQVAYGEWTQRLWIVQEQLLNKEITILRGHRLLNWDAIAFVPILFAIGHLPRQYRDAGRRDSGESLLSWARVEQIQYGTWWERHARLQPGASHTWSSLFHNLQWYQPLQCGDPRDRVYAILAISHDSEVLGLNPDYSSHNTVDALSRELSIRVLENAVNLKLLSFSFSWRQANSKLPSWCLTLDYSVNTNPPETIPFNMYTPHPKTHGPDLARFCMDDSILVVKGRILDYASASSSSINITQTGFFSSLIDLLHGGFSMEDITCLLRTITAKAPWTPPAGAPVDPDEMLAFHLWAYLRHSSRMLAGWAETSPTASSEEMLERCSHIMTEVQAFTPNFDYSELQSIDDMAEEEYLAIERVLQYALEQGRCLGRTRAKRFYNATYAIQEGDAIVALQGADRLSIIRLVENNTYKLIGDIFVDGLMYGEAYENQDPDEVDYDIELT